MVLTAGQMRAARGFVGWSARQLAEAANLGLSTVQRVEAGGSITGANMDALRRALEEAGVTFTNGDEPGVKLRRKGENDV